MKEIVRLVVVLGLICIVAGLTLAGVHQLTLTPIEYQRLLIKEKAIKAVLSDYNNNPLQDRVKLPAGKDKKGKDIFKNVFPAKKDGKVIALALDEGEPGYSGVINVMVGLAPEGKILGLSIVSHTETPGKGSRVTEADYTQKYKGISEADISKIDTISGATISSKAVVRAVTKAVQFYTKNKDAILAQMGK
ncbi:MAG: RnfABCDGE type electron transport complex subunit G [Pseudomonadota bacterium]